MAAVKISRHGFSRNMLYKGGLELCRNVGTGRLFSTLSELLRICCRICQIGPYRLGVYPNGIDSESKDAIR